MERRDSHSLMTFFSDRFVFWSERIFRCRRRPKFWVPIVRIIAREVRDYQPTSAISLKKRGGPTHHIELVRQSVGRWCDGKYSAKLPEATANQIAEHIGR